MQRRAALAASLLHHPDLIVLDEPTAGIDPVLRAQLWSHFEELRDEGRTLIVTTQYIGEARYCDRVAVIVDGGLLAFDTPRGLRHRVHGGDVVDVVLDGHIPADLLDAIERHELALAVKVIGRSTLAVTVADGGEAIAALGPVFGELGHSPLSMEERIIDFDEMFVQLVRAAGSEAPVGAH
jgi:ABC-2 type transport system ATP-binding protein